LITDLKNQEAMAILDNENLSLAIGKQGQNVRLAARLTHFKIDVKSEKEAAEQGIVIKQEEE
jgi:N utilization substance protein A